MSTLCVGIIVMSFMISSTSSFSFGVSSTFFTHRGVAYAPLTMTLSPDDMAGVSSYFYRTAREEDITQISRLLQETFQDKKGEHDDDDGDGRSCSFSSTSSSKSTWWKNIISGGRQQQQPSFFSLDHHQNGNQRHHQEQQEKQRQIQEQQQTQIMLHRRWSDMVQNPNVPHIWIVVTETTPIVPASKMRGNAPATTSMIVGFMELGTMPAPVPTTTVRKQEVVGHQQDDNAAENEYEESLSFSDTGVLAPTSKWHGIAILSKQQARAAAAVLGSTSPASSHSRQSSSDRPFLANLAVSKEHRRQGIATTLVKLALKLSQKWWSPQNSYVDGDDNDDVEKYDWSMYLGVDKDNEAATRLYQSLNFTVVWDETDHDMGEEALIASSSKMQSRRSFRPARAYYAKKLFR